MQVFKTAVFKPATFKPQVDYLHNLGTITLLSACGGSSSSTAAADKQTAAVVAALAADVEAYQLLQQLQQVSAYHAAFIINK
jgi:chitinase